MLEIQEVLKEKEYVDKLSLKTLKYYGWVFNPLRATKKTTQKVVFFLSINLSECVKHFLGFVRLVFSHTFQVNVCKPSVGT